MDISTLSIVIFGITLTNFILAALVIILGLITAGIILLIRNIRPILGFLLLIFALAMIIGIIYDATGIEKEINKFWSQVGTVENTEQPVDNSQN